MTVSELIEALQRYDKDMDVVFGDDYVHEVYNTRVGTVNGFWRTDNYQCVVLDGDQIGTVVK